jgi:hypothetical protein
MIRQVQFIREALAAIAALVVLLSASLALAQSGARYTVTITNLTKGQTFTPVLLATHTPATRLFAPGTFATPELRIVAEEGDTAPLAALLRQSPEVRDIVIAPGLQPPAVTATFEIGSDSNATRLSLVAMLIPTNDAFVGMNVALPNGFDPITVDALAYDSGTEVNDERCATIPGPNFIECRGPGMGGRAGNGEGAVTVHNGMHGVGDMNRPLRDWRGPVARITVQRTR